MSPLMPFRFPAPQLDNNLEGASAHTVSQQTRNIMGVRNPTSHQATGSPPSRSPQRCQFPKGTKIVEISNGRQFVSLPLDRQFLVSHVHNPHNPLESRMYPTPQQHFPAAIHPHSPAYAFQRGSASVHPRPMYPLAANSHQLSFYMDQPLGHLAEPQQQQRRYLAPPMIQYPVDPLSVAPLIREPRLEALPPFLPFQQNSYRSSFLPPRVHNHPIRYPSGSTVGQRHLEDTMEPRFRPNLFHAHSKRVSHVDDMVQHQSRSMLERMRQPSLRSFSPPSRTRNQSLPLTTSGTSIMASSVYQPFQSLFQKSAFASSAHSPVTNASSTDMKSESASAVLTHLFEKTRASTSATTAQLSHICTNVGTSHRFKGSRFAGFDGLGAVEDSDCVGVGRSPRHRDLPRSSPTSIPESPSTRTYQNAGGIGWLFEAAAASGEDRTQSPHSRVARSELSLSPPRSQHVLQAVPPTMLPNDAWQFNRAEDLVDDNVLFRHEETQRRKNPRYLATVQRFQELHIVMPITIPYGQIVVGDPLGSNFYRFSNKPKNAGAEILFGNSDGLCGNKENHKLRVQLKDKTDGLGINPVCDVWASFLHVRLGTIYNLTLVQTAIAADLFRKSFDPDLCKFYVPIAMDCRGVHPSSDKTISQRATRPQQLNRDTTVPRKTVSERYETHAVPTTENDIKRLQMLRRHVRQFALRLMDELRIENAQPSDLGPSWTHEFGEEQLNQTPCTQSEYPVPCVELHENCKADTILNGTLKIVVREWTPLSDPEAFKRVWGGHLASPDRQRRNVHQSCVAAEVRTKVLERKTIPSARVFTGELRLEHNSLKMVDPRWPDELIPGRRVAHAALDTESAANEESRARFVFCSRVPKPQVVYAYAEADGSDPRDVALGSRMSSIFKVHLARYPTAGVSASHRINSSLSTMTDASPDSLRLDPMAAPHDCLAMTAGGSAVAPDTEKPAPDPTRSSDNDASTRQQPPSGEQDATKDLIHPFSAATSELTAALQNEVKSNLNHQTSGQRKPIASLSELVQIPEPFVPMPSGEALYHNYAPYGSTSFAAMPEILHGMLKQTSEVERRTADQSALKSDYEASPPISLSAVACKYFLKDGCARGSFCKFLHPADPQLESKVDVREVVPKHPKFF